MTIGAIIVLFNPDNSETQKVVEVIQRQVNVVCLVDNSINNHQQWYEEISHVTYIHIGKNIGIAAAQNVGIKALSKKGCDMVLLCDQDSMPTKDTVAKLVSALNALQAKDCKIAAVGTKAINQATGKPYPQKSKAIRHIKASDINSDLDVTECYSLRSSMSLIPLKNFENVGYFDESLFIDGVDHEWCWRAWHRAGLRSFMVNQALLYHKLGEGDKKILQKDISIASPFRLYYQYRNYIWLCQRDYTPSFWKKKHLLKYAIKMAYFPIFVSPRMEYTKRIVKGIRDGLFVKNTLKQ
jgi:rhamnosyltransferase